jgi:hypothetical protein
MSEYNLNTGTDDLRVTIPGFPTITLPSHNACTAQLIAGRLALNASNDKALATIRNWQHSKQLTNQLCNVITFTETDEPNHFFNCAKQLQALTNAENPPRRDEPRPDLQSVEKAVLKFIPTLLYYDNECFVIVPSTCTSKDANDNDDCDGPTSKIKPVSVCKAGLDGRFSSAHVIVLPRRNLFNACSLTVDDVGLIAHMERVGRAVIRTLIISDNCKPSNVQGHGVKGITDARMFADIRAFNNRLLKVSATQAANTVSGYMPGGLCLDGGAAQYFGEQIVAAFQVYPNNVLGHPCDLHSQNFLHMHVFAMAGLSPTGGRYLSAQASVESKMFSKVSVKGTLVPVVNVIRFLEQEHAE